MSRTCYAAWQVIGDGAIVADRVLDVCDCFGLCCPLRPAAGQAGAATARPSSDGYKAIRWRGCGY